MFCIQYETWRVAVYLQLAISVKREMVVQLAIRDFSETSTLPLDTCLAAVKGSQVTLAIATHHLRISRPARVYARCFCLTFSTLYAGCNALDVHVAVRYLPGALLERIICRRYAALRRTRMSLVADTWLHYISQVIPLPPSNVSDVMENCVTA